MSEATEDQDQDQAAGEGVDAGEEFAGFCMQGRIDGAHAAQQPRRILECVDGGHALRRLIAPHANAERRGDQRQGDGDVGEQASRKPCR